jgi:hypothetical protein
MRDDLYVRGRGVGDPVLLAAFTAHLEGVRARELRALRRSEASQQKPQRTLVCPVILEQADLREGLNGKDALEPIADAA